ncbi:lipid-A-disaccharide synthase [Synechocystis sp. LKSZ1]|uniref:lipid-A-disaccharide synthase n=1 Tax=Synechocystis sp. LKSZ1 TaxID=3144951 RepID=UPI00336BF82E
MSPVDILILSNGPGEVMTWVRPVVERLHQILGAERPWVRISLMLSPCPHAMGKEAEVARRYPEIDRVQESQYFFDFLLWGKTRDHWDWHSQGVVVFLGGDQFYTLLAGRRLDYRTVVYGEWEARWYRWLDAFGVMNESVRQSVPAKYRDKLKVIGDLMADVGPDQSPPQESGSDVRIGLLPGSKASKLAQGVPLCLATAEQIKKAWPDSYFQLFVAPTVDLPALANYADLQRNPLAAYFGQVGGQIHGAFLTTTGGLEIELVTQFPADAELGKLTCAITTVGANTAQLGALGIPMVVLLPTQQLDAMRSWDGLPGLLARLPGLGSLLARGINALILRQNRRFAWPNIWAKREIVPELVGQLTPQQVAGLVVDWLAHPEKLQAIRADLRAVRGQPGATQGLVDLILEQMQSMGWTPQDSLR